MAKLVASRFQVFKKIGAGSFGEIFSGEHMVTHQPVAIKMEPRRTTSQLKNESKIYKLLAGEPGFPNTYWYGNEGDTNILVMDLLGDSLEKLVTTKKEDFSLKTVLMIADQMINQIQYLHEVNYIHRDIKPDNFLLGKGKNKNLLHLIDFGLSKKYRDPKTQEHIPYREDRELTGTARYVSINTHMGIEQSRRDDLECIGYVLIYLIKGRLPWQGIQCSTTKEKFDAIAQMKLTTSYQALCEGLPSEFADYFSIVRNLEFVERPPYYKLKQMFRKLFIRLTYVFDYKYDWSVEDENDNRRKSTGNIAKIHAPLFENKEIGLEDQPKNSSENNQTKLPPLNPNRAPISFARTQGIQRINTSLARKKHLLKSMELRQSFPITIKTDNEFTVTGIRAGNSSDMSS